MSTISLPDSLPREVVEPVLRAALGEDLGMVGDVTSIAVIPRDSCASGTVSARVPGVAAGVQIAALAFELIDPDLRIEMLAGDGGRLQSGAMLLRVAGDTRSILGAERVALNFLQRLSGIATASRRIVDAIAHTPARLLSTRKTTPTLRVFEKYAVRCGGGGNHRFGLHDGILIKDNHIAANGGDIDETLRRARDHLGEAVRVQIEVDDLAQLDRVLTTGLADAVLLDNMDPDSLRQAVARTGGALTLEASGGITVESAARVAETGVDFVSCGWITHSAPALDLGLDFG